VSWARQLILFLCGLLSAAPWQHLQFAAGLGCGGKNYRANLGIRAIGVVSGHGRIRNFYLSAGLEGR